MPQHSLQGEEAAIGVVDPLLEDRVVEGHQGGHHVLQMYLPGRALMGKLKTGCPPHEGRRSQVHSISSIRPIPHCIKLCNLELGWGKVEASDSHSTHLGLHSLCIISRVWRTSWLRDTLVSRTTGAMGNIVEHSRPHLHEETQQELCCDL